MFEGFSPLLKYIVPTLDEKFVVSRMHEAINYEEQEIIIREHVKALALIGQIIPLNLMDKIIHYLVGNGMRKFKGRDNAPN